MKVVSEKELRIALLNGVVIMLYPGIEKEVSDEVGIAAMGMGAKQVGTDPVKVTLPEPTEEEGLVKKLVALMTEGNPTDFKKDGTPKAAVVTALAGRPVSTEEREAAWEAALRS